MAQWSQVQGLPGVQQLYGNHFPLELRHYFAPWIEAQPWDKLDPSNESHEALARQLFEGFVANLQEKMMQLAASPSGDTFLLRLQLDEIKNNMVQTYGETPLELVRVVLHCLNREREELAKGPAEQQQAPQATDDKGRVLAEFQKLRWCLQDTGNDCSTLQQAQESFVIQYQDFCKLDGMYKQLEAQSQQPAGSSAEVTQRHVQLQQIQKQKQAVEQHLAREADGLVQGREALFQKFGENITQLGNLQDHVLIQPLKEWHLRQLRGTATEQELSEEIDGLQAWAEHLAEFIWQNRQQIRQLDMLQTQLPLDMRGGSRFCELIPTLNSLISDLVERTFIIDKQPPHVLKTQTKFATGARFLVGGKLNVHMDPPQVTVTIVNESQARMLAAEDMARRSQGAEGRQPSDPGHSGEILNNRKVMTYVQQSNVLNVAFKNLSLRKIRRGDSKVDQVVTEEKFALLFKSTFSIGGGDMTFCVHKLSLPVVVVVHGNQLPNAEATILWDNAFAEPERIPFLVPPAVPWEFLAPVLNQYFISVNQHPLSEKNLEYLAVKLLGDEASPSAMVSWQAFNKDSLPGRNFTFWEWFYGIVEITRKHLVNLWRDGLIVGFLSKTQAQELCHSCGDTTFLLRFSDSEVGGITVAWVGTDDQGNKQVWNLQPWFAKDFTIRSLADRIHDLPQLQYLFPDAPKDTVFGPYYSQMKTDDTKNDGYVQSGIAAVIPGKEPPQFPMLRSPDARGFGIDPALYGDYSMEMISQDLMAGVNAFGIDPSLLQNDDMT